MQIGANPINKFYLPFVPSEFNGITKALITYKQGQKIIVEKSLDDITVTDNVIQLRLTQAETLKFESGGVKIQLRLLLGAGDDLVSNPIHTNAAEVLNGTYISRT